MRDVDIAERFGLAIVLAGLLGCIALFFGFVLLPADRWMEVREVTVHDSPIGEPIVMDLDRTIHRDFEGAWRVAIWRSERDGWVPVCTTGWKDHFYRSDAIPPEIVTLQWYTEVPACWHLSPGVYRMDTDWIVNRDGLFERRIRRHDVLFEVTPEVAP